ncbi:MAG: hypothetical protein JRC90_07815 [Deltaproteobacteria bacterium]|nr:hypothetical protein [Deltaproteobacteria bacterium]
MGTDNLFHKIKERKAESLRRRRAEKYLPAYTNARRVEEFHKTSGTDNPSTLVHSLVEYLRDLKRQ